MIYFMIYLRNKRIWIYRNIKQNRMKSIDNQVWAGVVMSLLHRQLPPNRNWGVTGFVCILRLLDVTGQVRDCPCLCNYFLVQTSYCFTAHNYTCYRQHQAPTVQNITIGETSFRSTWWETTNMVTLLSEIHISFPRTYHMARCMTIALL